MTWTNPRFSASLAELKRGCSFAENFTNDTRVLRNAGVDTGTGNSTDHGLTVDGNGHYVFDVVTQADDFSAVARFTGTTKANKLPDGDMVKAGVTDWTALNNAILSKISIGKVGVLEKCYC